MLEVLKVIILGIVQGITEWLPISSTGHLILVEQLIQLKQSEAFTNMFNVVIQFGSILAVVVIYFHKLNRVFKKFEVTQVYSIIPLNYSGTIYNLITGKTIIWLAYPFAAQKKIEQVKLQQYINPVKYRNKWFGQLFPAQGQHGYAVKSN